MMNTNDAVLVPFRCPDCKDKRSFETLKNLRSHLQAEHSDIYSNSARKRLDSQYSGNARTSPILELLRADAIQIEENLKSFKERELNNRKLREEIPVQTSTFDPRSSMERSRRDPVKYRREDKSTFRNYGHPSRVKYKYFQKHDKNRRNSDYDDFLIDQANLPDEDFLDDSNPRGTFPSRETKVGRRENSVERIQNLQRPMATTWSNEDLSFRRRMQSLGSELDSHVQETLSALSHEVVIGRSTQQSTLDSLRTSNHIYSQVEQSAQERISRQQEIIASLALKLSEKEEQMASILMEMNSLKKQHDEEIEVKNVLNQKSTYEREKLLQEEITQKQNELESLSQRLDIARQAVKQYRGEINEKRDKSFKPNNDTMDNIKRTNSDLKQKHSISGNWINSHNDDDAVFAAEMETNEDVMKHNSIPQPIPNANHIPKEMTAKEYELNRLRGKSKQLESDRQTLLLEMQTLLETAATDNEKLRTELTNQGKQLSKLNLELERSKQEQSELLGETNTLYFQADLSLTRLKQMLEDKDGQLTSVSGQLEIAKDMQNKLIKERDEYLIVAEEKENRYRAMVQENAVQLQSMKDSLKDSQVEKTKLEAKMMELKQDLQNKEKHDEKLEERLDQMESHLTDHETWQVTMLEQINDKEDRLKKAKASMEKMNAFLSDAADRELDTRSKLEQFIATLVDRSTQAEEELLKMKSAYVTRLKNLGDDEESKFESSIDWPRTSERTKSMGRQNSDDVFLSDQNYNVRDGRYERTAVDEESYVQPIRSMQKKKSLTEMKKIKSNNRNNRKSQPEKRNKSTLPKMSYNEESIYPSRTRELSAERRTSAKRRVKNRPLLIQGKEFPSDSYASTSFGKSNSLSHKDQSKRMYKSLENLNKEPRLERKTLRSGLSNIYLDRIGSDFEHSLPRISSRSRAPKLSSGLEKMYNRRNRSVSPITTDERYRLFRNTPEVNEMYKNVQKTTAGHKENSNPTRPSSSKHRRLSSDFIMTDDGIILESFDYPKILRHQSSSQEFILFEDNSLSGYQDSFNSYDMEELSHEESEEDKPSPVRMKKSKQNKTRSRTNIESPPPLGDKIAKVLNSMDSNPLQSAARKDYSDNMKNRFPSSKVHNNYGKPIQTATSDSLESSPVHRAQAVKKRVEKLTSSVSQRVSPQPAPRSKDRLTNFDNSMDDLTDGYSPIRSGINSKPPHKPHHTDSAPLESDFSFTSYASVALDENSKKNKSRSNSVSWIDTREHDKENEIAHENLERQRSIPHQSSFEFSVNGNQFDHVVHESYNNSMSEALDVNQFATELQKSHDYSISETLNVNQFDTELHDSNDHSISKIGEITSPLHIIKRESSDEELNSPSSYRSQRSIDDKPWLKQSSIIDEDNVDGVTSIPYRKRQPSLERQDSISRPFSSKHYNLVMKELMAKHPYIESSQKEGHSESDDEPSDVKSLEVPVIHESFESNKDFQNYEEHQAESTDYGVPTSDEEPIKDDADENFTQKANVVESIEASTDTDLEKLARPGHMHKINAARKKKRPLGKRSDARAKRSTGFSDTSNWTSTDTNDFDETDHDERLTKRRRRVALFCVMNYLDTATLLIASQVSREWRKISHHPTLWKKVELRNNSIGSEFLVTLSQWCTQTESLKLTGLTGRAQKLIESEDDYHVATRGSLETGLERLLFACQGSLQTLTIEHCENILTDKCLWLISGNCRMLTSLCYRSADHPVTPQLLWALGGGCPGITKLMVHPVPKGMHSGAMNNRFLLLIGQFYRDVQEIGLGGTEFDMAGLLPMIQSCQRIKVIHLDNCIALTDDLATAMCRSGLKDLQTLTVSGTNVQAKAIQTLQKNCRHLRKISVSVTLQDYDLDPSKRKDRDVYKKSVQALTDLKEKAGFSNILSVEAEAVQ